MPANPAGPRVADSQHTAHTRGRSPGGETPVAPSRRRVGPFARIFLGLTLLAAFGLRVLQLDRLPALLSRDESINGLDALLLWRAHWLTPFLQNNFGRETLFFYLQGLFLKVFGISMFSMRFLSAVCGVLTVGLLFATAKILTSRDNNGRLFSPQIIAVLAAAGLAGSHWSVYFGRLALRANLLPIVLLLFLGAFWRGLSAEQPIRRRRWFLVSGILMGLSMYTYLAARLLPAIALAFFVLRCLQERYRFRAWLADFAVCFGAGSIVSLPLLAYFWRNPEAIGGRAEAISLFSSATPWWELGRNLGNWLFIQFGGGLWLAHWPSLTLPTGLGLLLGLVWCLRHIGQPLPQMLLLWWGGGWVPVILSQQHWDRETTILRGIVAWPAVFLIAAIGLVTLYEWLRRMGKTSTGSSSQVWRTDRIVWPALTIVLLLAGGAQTANAYFARFAAAQPWNERARVLDLVTYLNERGPGAVFLPNALFTDDMTRFLLQPRFPVLSSLDSEDLCRRLASEANQSGGVDVALPAGSTSHSAFSVLETAPGHPGVAYLSPRLTDEQVTILDEATRSMSPRAMMQDAAGNEWLRVFPFPPDLESDLCQTGTTTPVRADFGGQFRLSGFRVEPAIIRPSQTVRLFLEWSALRPMGPDYDLFVHLFALGGDRVAQINASLGNTLLLTGHWWPVDAPIADTHKLTIPESAAEGPYRFEIGLYHRNTQRRLPVTAGEGVDATADSVVLGKLLVRKQPVTAPRHRLDVHFADEIDLVGISVDPEKTRYRPADEVGVRLFWLATGTIRSDYTVFTHLVGQDGKTALQRDNMPQQNRYPTSLWSPGEVVPDDYTLILPPDLPPGAYELRVGLYQLETGRRVPLADGSADYAHVTNLEVRSH